MSRDANYYGNPEAIVCTFSYEELAEISESLLFTRRNDPDADRDFLIGLRSHVSKIMKKTRQKNPDNPLIQSFKGDTI